ncbi:CDP photolyase [Xylona heveae TC161]|uniref:CDP photolyase n=1 Tax=Xylona heveae (strain CBS 132557 / TC161) TaxID=1328760 RepID=A0A165I5Q5_XYLHT|nr:CDP photolyase [Xylona heveae TC161]KZF24424.1 CDP photolyase [Xylona heveae TC161]
MPPSRTSNRKRQAGSKSASPEPPSKRRANGNSSPKKGSTQDDDDNNGYVLREFYPPEMSNKRCLEYAHDEITRPIEELQTAIEETAEARKNIKVKNSVVHWFKRDLRTQDNKSLALASEKAKDAGVPLIALFIVSPQDYQAHLTSSPRVDFELRTLQILKKDLAQLDIPLYVETVEKRKKVPSRVVELCNEWGASHVFCNIEYEVDELRREAKLTRLCAEKGIEFSAVHDTCVVPPGELASQQGKQYAVYSPWFRAWIAHLHSNPDLLEKYDSPGKNSKDSREKFKNLFDSSIPDAPANKMLNDEEKKRFHSLWPAGEHEAHDRLDKFLNQKIGHYTETRNYPAANSTALLSVHFSSGTLSARTAVRQARDANTTKKLDGGNSGITGWISEVAWRDFYKHVLVHWPYICMNKPFKPEYANIEWSYSEDNFQKWCQGQTGYPIVDAAMHQLNHMGYMHNRCRMIVASFLSKHLLIDWRKGERYFMEHLIDGDFASNNGGWGFSSSTGVDPQPYFRIFNPLMQSERFDPEGEYIRKWLPELKDVEGKAIHAPYERGAEKIAAKNNYPKPMIEHKFGRDRALSKYKEGLGRDTA